PAGGHLPFTHAGDPPAPARAERDHHRADTGVEVRARATDLPRGILELCDIVVPNQHEVAQLGGTSALLDAGVGTVVITLGARGIRVVTREGEWEIPPFVVRAIDTTGAGDAACGALVAALSQGADVLMAARRASAAGALAATRRGAVPSLPSAEEIDALVN
ncbi:MAG: PfkB family carbohydrate kinase, partial [Actinomycetota bacterium]